MAGEPFNIHLDPLLGKLADGLQEAFAYEADGVQFTESL